MNEIETVEYKGYQIKICQDEDPENPRDWENLGTMLCKHRRYDLGDKKESEEMSSEEIKEYVKRDDVIAIPLYLLDHSGLWMRTGRFACDAQGWDTSHVGYITVTREKALKEYSKKKMTRKFRAKIEGYLENEVKTYSDYLEGNVVGYVIEKDGEEFDSCWGFYPDKPAFQGGHQFEYMLSECRSHIDRYVEEDKRIETIQENVTSA
jgi:hypothetical protein